jgi:hypothetical protein
MANKDYALELAGILHKLKDLKIDFAQISYNGGGDSGAIENMGFYSLAEMKADSTNVDDLWTHDDWDVWPDGQSPVDPDKTLTDKLEDWATETILNNIEDWWNNEGGYGVLTIDVNNAKWIVANNCYRQETDKYSHKGSCKDASSKMQSTSLYY